LHTRTAAGYGSATLMALARMFGNAITAAAAILVVVGCGSAIVREIAAMFGFASSKLFY
jgi:hypothetical protein